MKLYYYKAKGGNVGDDLNPWLMPKILGESLDEDQEHLLIGIGTLLNNLIPLSKKYTVLTTGIGYGGGMPNLNYGEWDFIGVRGPLTKKSLNISQELCLLDGAYLMPRFFEVNTPKKYNVAYIPHVDSIVHGMWEDVCEMSGVKLIDPRWPVERFIRELCSCEKVLTEAMHGAILADAYGIPWKPVKAYNHINVFKWDDWAMSLNMKIKFDLLEPTWKGDMGEPIKRKIINGVKRGCKSLGYFPKSWMPVFPSRSKKAVIESVAGSLALCAKSGQFFNSNEGLRNNRTDLLLETMAKKFRV